MLIWYLVTAVVGVWAIFDSPAIDHRFVMAGAALPVVEVVLGRPGPLHSLVIGVGVLTVVMLTTQGRRLVRRRWLGIPIGLLCHLVFSGVWADTHAFWWPLFGIELSSELPPELARGALSIVFELGGIALGLWWVRRVGLDDAANRSTFWSTGRLPRTTTPPVTGSC